MRSRSQFGTLLLPSTALALWCAFTFAPWLPDWARAAIGLSIVPVLGAAALRSKRSSRR